MLSKCVQLARWDLIGYRLVGHGRNLGTRGSNCKSAIIMRPIPAETTVNALGHKGDDKTTQQNAGNGFHDQVNRPGIVASSHQVEVSRMALV